jgi:hypothetical protein
VIAGDKHHSLAAPRPAQHFLHKGVLVWSPVDAAAHCPEVDDIADQKEIFGLVFAQKAEQTVGLTGAGTEVNIGEKN